jgi:hypothetical protein
MVNVTPDTLQACRRAALLARHLARKTSIYNHNIHPNGSRDNFGRVWLVGHVGALREVLKALGSRAKLESVYRIESWNKNSAMWGRVSLQATPRILAKAAAMKEVI